MTICVGGKGRICTLQILPKRTEAYLALTGATGEQRDRIYDKLGSALNDRLCWIDLGRLLLRIKFCFGRRFIYMIRNRLLDVLIPAPLEELVTGITQCIGCFIGIHRIALAVADRCMSPLAR